MGTDVSRSDWAGKYVCFGREDGTFCWGRIERETLWNTGGGQKEAFILTGMMTCSLPAGTTHAVAFTKEGARMMDVTSPGAAMVRKRLGVREHKGERLLRKDQIDLSRDIFDWDGMSDDQLFLLAMRTRLDQVEGLPPAVKNMVLQGLEELPENVERDVIRELKERVEITE